jgi:hypothetical protein
MRGLVPDVVRLSESKPYFNDPLADALDGPDRALLEELFATPALARYVRSDRVALDVCSRRRRVRAEVRSLSVSCGLRVFRQRFLINTLTAQSAVPLTVVLNWTVGSRR